jgi:predicted patatin/cPLA2 family phospholipase
MTEPAGHQPQAVIDLLKRRAAQNDPPAARSDGRKIGLVLQGGSMRGICSGAGAVALAKLGLTELFDAVYATSAGAMNAAYFLSNQPKLGIRIYYEDLVDRRFVNPLRFWKMMNVDYVFDSVVARTKPLAVDQIIASSPEFFVAMTDAQSAEGRIVDVKRCGEPVLRVLKAAIAMPVYYNRAVAIGGRASIDGGLVIPFPIDQALADGCTDLVVLLTNPPDFHPAEPTWQIQAIFNQIAARGKPALRRAFALHHEKELAMCDLAMGRTAPPAGVHIATFCTEASDRIGRLTFDANILRDAGTRYGRRVLAAFGEDDSEWELPAVGSGA